jgi:hypothetical protein
MGIIDPMAIGNAATTGVLDFGGGPILWCLSAALLASTAAAIALSALHRHRPARPASPKLPHAQLAAVGMSRAQ